MAIASTVLPTYERLAPCETSSGNGRPPTPRPRRSIGLKELSWLFDLTERQLGRLQNGARETRRKDSCRIQTYTDEESAKLAAIRIRKGKGFDRTGAEHPGCLALLDQVAAEADRDSAATDPARYRQVRIRLMLELAIAGAQSPLSQKMGLTTAELSHQAEAPRKILSDLLAEVPSVSPGLTEFVQGDLVAQGIRCGMQVTTPPRHKIPFGGKTALNRTRTVDLNQSK